MAVSPRSGQVAGRRRAARPDRLAAARRIVVVMGEGMSPFHLAVPWLVFGEDRSDVGCAPFEVILCSAAPGSLELSMGLTARPAGGPEVLASADLVVVPSWPTVDRPPAVALLRALRTAHARGTVVAGLCLGAYVLGHAGLLDARRATTHWAWADDFRGRFPAVVLDADVLYVDEGSVVTSAGTVAAVDCCLHLLARMRGTAVANRVARRLVVAPHRDGGQAQFIERPVPASAAEGRLQQLISWLESHLGEAHSVDALAERVAMSRRTFTRHFQRATGSSMLEWLLRRRLSLAGSLLESGDASVESVAAMAGFGSPEAMRQRFASVYRLSPSAYRARFRSRPPAA